MQNPKNLYYFIITRAVLLLSVVAILYFVLPIKTALIDRDLEDVAKYIADLKIQAEKMVVQKTLAEGEEVITLYNDQPQYFRVINSCDWQFLGDPCVQVMTGPGMSYPQAHRYYEHQGPFPERIRMGQMFQMFALVKSKDGSLWYKIAFDERKILFRNRIRTDWYVPAEYFALVDFTPINPENDTIKNIVVILHEQALYAYEGKTLFMKTSISTGQEKWGLGTTPGVFDIYKKVPMAIMEGPLPGMASLMTPSNLPDFEYTLFVPFAMAYYPDVLGTAFIHGTYWHNGFGTERSHGCVNVNYTDALTLYNWTPDPSIIKISVTVLP